MAVEVLRQDITTEAGATQWLVRDPATHRHFIVSGVNALFTGWEVLVFPADANGEVQDWSEVVGGRGISHEDAIAELEDHLAEGDAE